MTDDAFGGKQGTSDHPDMVALPAGVRIGRYEVVSVLGQGGFGITYLARDLQLGREVAIKEYLPAALAGRFDGRTVRPLSTRTAEDFHWGRDRFVEEGRTIASLHEAPGIVHVFDFLEANGTAYIVMRLVRGTTLQESIRREGRLGLAAIQKVLGPLLVGLEQVHAKGFLHRDIKPLNILLDGQGSPTLIDFGASRAAMADRTVTMTAVFTPRYGAAEQFTSARQGPWTDIYGLAATLYHAIAGKPPPPAVDRVIEDTLEPLGQLALPGFPEALLAGIEAGLAPRHVDRPQTIAAWRALLDRADSLADSTIAQSRRAADAPVTMAEASPPVSPSASTPAPARRRAALWAGIAAVAVVVAMAGTWFAFAPSSHLPAGLAGERQRIEEQVRRAREQLAVAEQAAQRQAQEEDRQAKVEQERRVAAAAAEKQRAEEEARRKAQAEAEIRRRATIEEARRKAEVDAETRRQAAAEEARRKEEAEAEARRQAAAEDMKRKAEHEAEAETRRQAAAEEAKRKATADAAERARVLQDAQKAREALAAAESARLEAEAEAERLKASLEARRQADAAAAATKQKADAEAAAAAKADLENAAQRKAAADHAMRQKVEADATLRKTEDDQRKAAEAAEAQLRLSQIDRQRLQVALTALGFDTRGADGVFGPRSREMIAAWQRKQNQPATGFIAAAQQQTLLREAAPAIARHDEEQKKAEEARRKAEEEAKARAGTSPASAQQLQSPSPAVPSAAPAAPVASSAVSRDGLWFGALDCKNTGRQSIQGTVTNGSGRLAGPNVTLSLSISGAAANITVASQNPTGPAGPISGELRGRSVFGRGVLQRVGGGPDECTISLVGP